MCQSNICCPSPLPHDSRSLQFDCETLGMACLKDVLKYFIETKIYIYIFDSDCHKVRLMFRGEFTVGSLLDISFTRSQTIPLLKTFSIFCLELLTEVLENQKMWGSSKKGCWYKKMTHFNEDLILGVAITFFGGVCNNGRGWGGKFYIHRKTFIKCYCFLGCVCLLKVSVQGHIL